MTLRERCINEPIEFAKNNFLDEFGLNPDFQMIEESVLDLENLDEVNKSMLAAIVDEACHVYKVKRPDWIFDPQVYLDKPHFALNAKGDFRLILLRESPKWYSSRNLFVTANCSERV